MQSFRYRMAFLAACMLATVALFACTQAPAAPPAGAAPAAAAAELRLERGKTLVTVGACHDCHSPKKFGPKGPEPDPSRLLSGHPESEQIPAPYKAPAGSPWTIATTDSLTAWSGPWGISFAANLTPDRNTGLRGGVWTEELFIKALRTGKHMGTSRDILPPMPWVFYAQLSDDDLKMIWEYLGTIPPINNHVPEPVPPAETPQL